MYETLMRAQALERAQVLEGQVQDVDPAAPLKRLMRRSTLLLLLNLQVCLYVALCGKEVSLPDASSKQIATAVLDDARVVLCMQEAFLEEMLPVVEASLADAGAPEEKLSKAQRKRRDIALAKRSQTSAQQEAVFKAHPCCFCLDLTWLEASAYCCSGSWQLYGAWQPDAFWTTLQHKLAQLATCPPILLHLLLTHWR